MSLNMPKRIRPTVFSNSADAMNSMGSRRLAIESRTAERSDYLTSPRRLAIQRVRTAMANPRCVSDLAGKAWQDENEPNPLPIRGPLHPQRHAVLVAWLEAQGWTGADLTTPITPTPTVEDLIARFDDGSAQELADAQEALADLEAGRYVETDEAETVGPVAEAPRRGRAPRVQLDPDADVLPE